MASVTIDIPGVGNVEAKNAASEATLRELVNVMKGMKGGAGNKDDQKNQKDRNRNQKEDNDNHDKGTSTFSKLTSTVGSATTGFFKLGGQVTDTAKMFADLDGSIMGAAGIFSKLPIVGGLVGGAFTAVAGAADKLTKNYVNAAAGGASFGGSMTAFSAAASQAGMNMAEFGNLIKSNGEGMLGFGSTTEAGAKNFANVSKQLRASSSELYALGMSTEEINNGLAKYGSMMKQQGLQGTQSNAQLAAGAKKYLTELDALAKITGVERAAKEAEMQATLKDAQFQGAMADKSKEVRDSFLSTLGGLAGGMQGGLGNFAKDILATGTATTEENQKLMSMMGGSVALLQEMRGKMQRGEAVTEAERNKLNNMMATEGAKASKQMGMAFAATPEFAGTMNSLTLAASMQKDAVTSATKEQKEAAEKTDKMNKKMQEFQQSLAGLGNTFTSLLANSGMLDVLMNAFKYLGTIAESTLIPAFTIFSSIISKAADGVGMVFSPIIDYISKKFIGMGTTVDWIDNMMNTAFDAIGGAVRAAVLVFDGLWEGVSAILDPLGRLFDGLFGASDATSSFGEMLIDIGAFVGDALKVLGNVIGFLIDYGVSPLLKAFKFLLDISVIPLTKLMFGLVEGVSWVIDHLADFGDGIMGIVDSILNFLGPKFGGISDEEKKARDEARATRAEERAAVRQAQKDAKVADADKHKAELAEDKKHFAEKKVSTDKVVKLNEKEAAAKEAAAAKTDFGGNSLDILKSEVAIANGPAPSVGKAETAKKEMETKADKTEKEAAKTEEGKKPADSAKPAPTQESAETLLASLNTKLDQLIAVNKNMKDVQDRQLSVQQGLSGDLFASV